MPAPDPALIRDLARILSPERVLARPLDLLGRSADASMYQLIPQAVLRPRDLAEMRGLFNYAHARQRRLTFRAAGTSLSGQALSDDLLVEVGPHWRAARVEEDGRRVWTQPGVVGGHLNRLLAPHGTRIGPDPASIDTAMMGGILANNSSGMCCGVAQNSYHTLASLAVLLADGTLVNTAHADGDESLRRARPALHASLRLLRDEVRGDAELASRIRTKFRTKNTTGYSLNALLDFDAPADILGHLMVGSEGTLGFVAEMTLRTVPEPPARATGLLYFRELRDAGAAVAPLAAAGADALEIMDAASLRSQADERRYPFSIGERTAALLVEFRASDSGELEAALARARSTLAGFPLLTPPLFSTDPAEREEHWRLRKGLAPRVGALRPPGTSFLTEDVAVPAERLAEAIADCQALFARHGLSDAILFGHAKDGNLHFVMAEDLGRPEAVERYGHFLEALVELVVAKYDGAIKAEHGSGRNMAPFVRREWGEKAYVLMRRIKTLLDPQGILNPGVVLNDDPRVHLKNLKPMPSISAQADRCTECGFCEPRCPSRDLTLTPRQRIRVTRELGRLNALGGRDARELASALRAEFAYDGVTTCAGDSMCQVACPVKIDTGALVKEIRAATHSPFSRGAALWTIRHFGFVAALARTLLRVAHALRRLPRGAVTLESGTELLNRLLPTLVPRVSRELSLPRAAPPLPVLPGPGEGPGVVYFPSCLTRVLGALPGEENLPPARAALDLLQWAKGAVRYPDGIAHLCCGMPFASRGFPEAARLAAAEAAEALWRAASGGRDLVVTDASPCAATLQEISVPLLKETGRTLRILDFPAFWACEVLPGRGALPRRPGTALLHPTCSLLRKGGLPDLLAVARAHCESVVLPARAECCGFAGDRGYLVPELTASATVGEAAELRELLARTGGRLYSTCRTCEIGMSRAVGRPFGSLLHLVHEAVFDA